MSHARDRYPVVLAHGIARFDFLTDSLLKQLNLILWDMSRSFDRLHYFRGIASFLREHGFEVYHSRVDFAAGVSTRARELGQEVARVLAQSSCEKVHVIGHSMGGLDARHMIVDVGHASHVASLTTIGTPHLGTVFAEWFLEHGGDEAIRALSGVISLEGIRDLTRAARAEFNERAAAAEAANEVVYHAVASYQERERVFGPLKGSWDVIASAMGANDGLVSVASQLWQAEIAGGDCSKRIHQHHFPVRADHLNQLGWWDLDELRRAGWWRLKRWREKKRYEQSIQEIYLNIAREVSGDNP